MKPYIGIGIYSLNRYPCICFVFFSRMLSFWLWSPRLKRPTFIFWDKGQFDFSFENSRLSITYFIGLSK